MPSEASSGSRRGRPHAAPRRVTERRGSLRYRTREVGFLSSQIQASLVNLGQDGLAIESLEHPPIGATLVFTLERSGSRVDTDGEVCWCALRRTYRTVEGDVVPVYRAGIRLGDRRPPLLESIVRSAKRDYVAGLH